MTNTKHKVKQRNREKKLKMNEMKNNNHRTEKSEKNISGKDNICF